MTKQTPLHPQHLALNAKMVDFSGWDMPLHYGSQVQEHLAVRESAGMFDVSHMNPVHLSGPDAKAFLQYLLANDVAKCKQPGKALYSCMLNETGGVVDDLIVYYLDEDEYCLVMNAGTRDKDLAWLDSNSGSYNITIQPMSDVAMVAIQGPQAIEKLSKIMDLPELNPFQAAKMNDTLIARTGYTGEDGVEMIVPADQVQTLWQQALESGITPCGLGARDTLRLEAALNLYDNDMDEHISPLCCNLAWTVAFEPAERDFIGRRALEKEREQGPTQKMIALVLTERGVLRHHQPVLAGDEEVGLITSGSFSPSLGHAVALARVNADAKGPFSVLIRQKAIPVTQVKPPFVRHGKKVYTEI